MPTNRFRRSVASLLLLAGCAALLAPSAGCVRRKLTVTSDPPGALVTLNGEEAGRTPFTTDFTWYGFYEVEVRKDGYETAIERRRLIAPWWQFPPFDFVAELMPWQPTDRKELAFTLAPRDDRDRTAERLIDRGTEMRRLMNEGLPATQPIVRETAKPASSTQPQG